MNVYSHEPIFAEHLVLNIPSESMNFEYDKERHKKDIDAMLRATLELAAMDRTDMLIIERVPLTSTTRDGANIWLFQPRQYFRLLNALSFGFSRALFIPAALAMDFDGKMPSALPKGWIPLSTEISEGAEDGWLEMEPGSDGHLVLDKPGLLVFQPMTGTVALGKRLRLLAAPDAQTSFPIRLAAQSFYYTADQIKPPSDRADGLSHGNPYQVKAVQHSVTNDITVIWGPPGTGKSRTILDIIEVFVRQKLSVGVLATTNKAVDSVAAKILSEAGTGSFADRDLLGPRLVTRYGHLPANHAHLAELHIRHKLNRRNLRPEDVAKMLGQDCVSLMTIHSFLTMSPHVFDAVIIDEAGTTSLPFTYCALASARQKAVLVGDHCQIPPVVSYRKISANAKRWFGDSIFQQIKARHDGSDTRLLLLPIQYRMRDRLAQNVRDTRLYPQYLTPDGDKPFTEQGKKAIRFEPLPGREFCVVDVAGSKHAGKFKDNTNQGHFEVVTRLLEKYLYAGGVGHVGLICPYRNQITLYQRWKEERRKRNLLEGTVHAFQGSEANVVIYDTVEGEGSSNFFSNDIKHPESLNLLNVAFSRPAYKMVMVADTEYLAAALPTECCLNRVIAHARAQGEVVAAGAIRDGSLFVPYRRLDQLASGQFAALPRMFADGLLQEQLEEDTTQVRSEVRVYSPDIDPDTATSVLWFFSAKLPESCVLRLYAPRKMIGKLKLPEKLQLSVENPGKWPHQSGEIIFDGNLVYKGVPSLLAGHVTSSVTRFFIHKNQTAADKDR